jgi:hypothetical protein
VIATMTASHVDDVPTAEILDAWFEYLHVTRDQGLRYEEVEPWAWTRLQSRLAATTGANDPARRTDTAEGSSPAGESGYEGEDGA